MDKISVNSSTLDILFQASPIVQLTLVVLVFLSILCWGISINKWLLLRRIRTVNELFLVQFWKSSSLDQLYSELDTFHESPLARVFKAAKPQMSSMDNLERVIRKAMENELAKMESKLTLLATTGSTGPFIGLFGTVWGIMTSFHKIGATGNASLAVVAPGISEALIATAVGLAAAIPAVVLYNHFISKIRKEEIELNNFSADFLNLVKRNFFKSIGSSLIMGMSSGSGKSKAVLSEINVTPLVDVMLVLLIMFMVTTPLMQQGIQVELPKTSATGLELNEEPLLIVIEANRKITIAKNPIFLSQLNEKLKAIFKTRKNKQVYIQADRKVDYGIVAEVMAETKAAGITSLGLVTLPKEK